MSDRDLCAERGLSEADRNIDVEIIALPLEELVLLDLDDDVEIASGSSGCSSLSFAADSEPGTRVNPSGNLNLERLLLLDQALATTGLAVTGNNAPSPPALLAGAAD